MDWTDWLRLAAIIGMGLGAYRAFKALGQPFRFEGKTYRRNADGAFTTRWGLPVRDPALVARLAEAAGRQGPPPRGT
jgi:hypothetical protein